MPFVIKHMPTGMYVVRSLAGQYPTWTSSQAKASRFGTKRSARATRHIIASRDFCTVVKLMPEVPYVIQLGQADTFVGPSFSVNRKFARVFPSKRAATTHLSICNDLWRQHGRIIPAA